MLRITIEMVPGGIENLKSTLHVIEVWNDLTETKRNRRMGSYRYRISRKITGTKITWHKEGRIARFPRAAKNSVHLLREVLNDAYGR